MSHHNPTPTPPPPASPRPRWSFFIVPPGFDLTDPTPEATALLEKADPVTLAVYEFGRRAGVAEERSRVQLAAAEFGAYLGPAPELRDYDTPKAVR